MVAKKPKAGAGVKSVTLGDVKAVEGKSGLKSIAGSTSAVKSQEDKDAKDIAKATAKADLEWDKEFKKSDKQADSDMKKNMKKLAKTDPTVEPWKKV